MPLIRRDILSGYQWKLVWTEQAQVDPTTGLPVPGPDGPVMERVCEMQLYDPITAHLVVVPWQDGPREKLLQQMTSPAVEVYGPADIARMNGTQG